MTKINFADKDLYCMFAADLLSLQINSHTYYRKSTPSQKNLYQHLHAIQFEITY